MVPSLIFSFSVSTLSVYRMTADLCVSFYIPLLSWTCLPCIGFSSEVLGLLSLGACHHKGVELWLLHSLFITPFISLPYLFALSKNSSVMLNKKQVCWQPCLVADSRKGFIIYYQEIHFFYYFFRSFILMV